MRYLLSILFFLIFFSPKVYSNPSCSEFLSYLNFTDPPFNSEEGGNLYLKAPVDLEIYNLTDLNLKENSYTADISFKMFFLDERLNDLKSKLDFKSGFYCEYPYEQILNKYYVPEFYFNTTEILKTRSDILAFNFISNDFYVSRYIDNVSKFRSTIPFNFKNFPFDSQQIDFRVDSVPLSFWEGDEFVDVFLDLELDEIVDDPTVWANETIFGWSVTDFSIEYIQENEAVVAVMTLQRDYFYFLLKVMFPIILIVFISWSVFLIHPRAIEAKVNVTIVCLLALIAYNFVIEDNLPKVSYITIMDTFILTSYVFAALTTIFAIYSYRYFVITEGDKIKLNTMDKFVRNYSFIFFIIAVSSLGYLIYTK